MPFSKIIERNGGERAKIVVTNYALPGLKPDVGMDVFTQRPGSDHWDMCIQSAQDRELAAAMSVDDYIKKGRHPMFNAVTPAELLKAGVEAKRFGYKNPHIGASLHLTDFDGREVAIPVT